MNTRTFLLAGALVLSAMLTAQVNQTDAKGKQGPWERTWANSSQLRYKGQFKDDRPVGTFTYYSTVGKVESIVQHYPTGGASHAKHFHPNGKVMAEGRYVGEDKDSTWNYFDAEGHLRSTERWKAGKLNGDQEAFFAEGGLANKCSWGLGKRNGTCTEFFANGQPRRVVTYVNDIPDGVETVYYESGKKEIEGKYVKGEREGAWMHYNDDGSVQIQIYYAKGEYVKDQKENGTFKEYYPNEQPKSEVTYKNGKKDGRFVEYHDNGHFVEQPTKLGPDQNARQDTERVLQGQTIKREGTYRNDLLEGDVKEYDEAGKLLKTTTYTAGKESGIRN